MTMDSDFRRRLESGTLTADDALALLEWQLSLPDTQIDCALIRECDLFLSPDSPGFPDAQQEALYRRILAVIESGNAIIPSPSPGRASRRAAQPRTGAHRRPRRALLIALLALLLALAVGGIAYTIRRGVLNFTEDFGFAKMVSLEGAEEFVSSGSLAHLELEHVTVDVLEAVYDGAELRVVYSLTAKSGELVLAEHAENAYLMPGEAEGDVHMCDFISVNGQDAYFYDTWEAPGDAPGQMFYYLQTNLPEWGVDVSGAQELTIGLPMLPREEGQRGWGQVTFTIPAAVPQALVRSAVIEQAQCGGHPVTVERAVLSPLNGYIALRIEGLTREYYVTNMTNFCEVYGEDGLVLTPSRSEGPLHEDADGSMVLGFAITPPESGWPKRMILAMEFQDYSPDWEVTLRIE